MAYRKPEQGFFDFGDPPQAPPPPPRRQGPLPDNLYFAVLPDGDTAPQIVSVAGELRCRHALSGRVRPAELLHISLAAIGGFHGLPEAAVAAAKHIGGKVRAAPFKVTFSRASSFMAKERRPLVLRCGEGAAQLQVLRRTLGSTLGLDASALRYFTPHITLMYDRQPIPDTDLDEPITWTVRDFVLVHSLYGRSRHRHLAQWHLDG